MSSRSLLPRSFTWIAGGSVLACAIWLGAGLVHGPTRKHLPLTEESSVSDPAPASIATGMHGSAQSPAVHANAARDTAVAAAPITEDAFLNQHYQNQVVADVKPADTPEQFERKVRELDPGYAKLLDENAAEERRNALQNAAPSSLQKPRPGTDDER